jgi:hypothetical protein
MGKKIAAVFSSLSDNTCYMFILICVCLLLIVVISGTWFYRTKYYENFDNLGNALDIGKKFQTARSDAEIKELMGRMVNELVSVGAFPDTSQYVRKSELTDGTCVVNKATDRDQYIAKASIADGGPSIDMSQYVKKSAIPACPEKKCPEQVDLSGYVKKSSLFNQKPAPCICPEVKVSAGLCKDAAPCPKVTCPACPVHSAQSCPPPQPCPTAPSPSTRYDIKYIKQPVLITKTIMVDANNNVIAQNIEHSDSADAVDSANASVNSSANTNVTDLTKYRPTVRPLSDSERDYQERRALYNGLRVGRPYKHLNNTTATVPTLATIINCNEQDCMAGSELNSQFRQSGAVQGAASPLKL